MNVKVTEYINCNGPIRWQISTSIKIIHEHFSIALAAFQKFTFQNVRPWKWRSKTRCTTFAVVLFDGKYLTSYPMAIVMFEFFEILTLKFMSRSWVQYSQLCHSMANINLHKRHLENFCASSYRLGDIKILKFWPRKFRSRSHGRKTGFTPFDSEYQPA